MKKILILANFDLGLYKFRKELIQAFLNDGNEVFISVPYGELVEKLKAIGCKFIDTPIDRRGINPLTDFKLLRQYNKILKEIKPDVVITYTIKHNIYGGIACRHNKIPYNINITGLGTAFQNDGMVKKIVCTLYRYVCKKAKVVFFENEENRQTFLENQLVDEKKTYKLNGAGVNTKEYDFAEYPSEDDPIHFLFIGRVMKEKGIDEIFAAAKKIKNDYPEIVFDVVGPFEDNYKEIIEELTKNGIIEYHGYKEDVRPFIKRANCFVLPSYHEGMANTLLECGAMGRPLITSRIHGCMEAVIEGKNGLLVKVMDVYDLEEKLRDFINMPYEQKVSMGKCSREHIVKVFDKEQVVRETIRKIRE